MCSLHVFYSPDSLFELPLWRNDATIAFFAQSVAYIERLRVVHIGRPYLAYTRRLWVVHIGRLRMAHTG